MDKWEYKIINIEESGDAYRWTIDEKGVVAMFNKLGIDGWEVISTLPIMRDGTIYILAVFLKRKLSQ
ncbi:MAG: DUF4177 domain-containing protein [Spirochaetaceae bacterium]|jgi:hypothetical protein|nr:DUF4177 domain-containing protein [Spirochaetaceae bacterium]